MVDGCECDELAKRFAQKGDIALAIDLDQTGEIQKVGIVRSPSQAASDAAVRLLSLEPVCRFIPAKDSQGNPIATRVDWVFRRVPMWCAKYPGLDAATAARVKPPEIDAARCGRGVWYPPEAIEKRVEGNVRLDIRVERDGRVSV